MSPTPAEEATRRRALQDLAAGSLSLLLSATLSLSHISQKGRLHQDFGGDPGPALLPKLLLSALALAGLGMTARSAGGLRLLRNKTVIGPSPNNYRPLITVMAIAALLLAFLLMLPLAGFGLSMGGLAVAIAMILTWQEGGLLRRAAIEGFVLAAFLYLLFRLALSVPLT